jgi:hypothetical protein
MRRAGDVGFMGNARRAVWKETGARPCRRADSEGASIGAPSTIGLGALKQIPGKVRNGSRDSTNVIHHAVRLELQVARELRALMRTNLAKPVLTAHLHRELQLLRPGIPIGERARHIVERRESRPSFVPDEDGVVLCVRIRSRDEPVQDERLDENVECSRRSSTIAPAPGPPSASYLRTGGTPSAWQTSS